MNSSSKIELSLTPASYQQARNLGDFSSKMKAPFDTLPTLGLADESYEILKTS